MPTLEVLSLQLRPGITTASPTLLPTLSTIRNTLQTKSRFYTCVEDPTLLFILGEWSSLSAHQAFLASSNRSVILEPQEKLTSFRWCLHLDLPADMTLASALPLTAPLMALERVWVKRDEASVAGFEAVMARYSDEIVSASSGRAFAGWRVDSPQGEREYDMFTGWDSVEAHARWRETMRSSKPEDASVGEYYDITKGGEQGIGAVEFVHLRDLEKGGADED